MSSDKHGHDGKRDHPRHFRREESHQASHSPAEPPPQHSIAVHPLVSQTPPEMVQTAPQLAEMIAHLKAQGAFAFDSEFIGERSYEPLLCLVQAATTKKVFLIDPLCGLDLGDFWELLVSPTVEKIVHAGQQDFGPAVQRTGRTPANVMDVQIAAGMIGTDYPLSLSKLLLAFVGVSVGKGLTFSHWDNRPLSEAQVYYAADDVRYLPAARAAIGKRLSELGRTDWAREECAAALENLSLYKPAPETLYLRVRGRDRLGRRELAVLRELVILRDQAARQEDMPARTLLKDGILTALSRWPAKELADLDDIRGLPRPVESKYGQQIVEVTAKALALPEDQWPVAEPFEDPAIRPLVDKMLADINQLCLDKSVAPSLIASRKELTLFRQSAAAGQSAQSHRIARGWRKELLKDLPGLKI